MHCKHINLSYALNTFWSWKVWLTLLAGWTFCHTNILPISKIWTGNPLRIRNAINVHQYLSKSDVFSLFASKNGKIRAVPYQLAVRPYFESHWCSFKIHCLISNMDIDKSQSQMERNYWPCTRACPICCRDCGVYLLTFHVQQLQLLENTLT